MVKICYACSAGGHLDEILQIAGKIKSSKRLFVTLKREDSISKLRKERKYYVADTRRNPFKTIINFFQSLSIFLKERPDMVITTGAGSALAICYWAKLFGKKVIFIESFAKINEKSLFGKLVAPVSDMIFVQWPEARKLYRKAVYAGPVYDFSLARPMKKKKQIFLTVGSSDYPFDRLVKAVDGLKADGYTIIGQIGNSSYKPHNFKHYDYLDSKSINKLFEESEIVISHAGVGTITNALRNGCKLLVMPRLSKYKEAINDHQSDVSKALETKNILKTIKNLNDLNIKIKGVMKTNSKSNPINHYKSHLSEIIQKYNAEVIV